MAISPTPIRKNWLRRLLPKLLSLGFSGLLAAAIAEFAVRKFLPWYDPTTQLTMNIDSSGSYAIGPKDRVIPQSQPGTGKIISVTYNRHGFRDPKDIRESNAGDICVVGDSYSFGWGVEDGKRYGDLLEKALGVPVHNIAIPGNDLAGYVGLTKYAATLGAKPGVLVVGVCMENDLRDYRQPWSPPRQEGARLWLRTHSALYTAVSYELQKRPALRGFFRSIGLAREGNTDALLPTFDLDGDALQTCADEVGRLRPLCQRLVAVIIPSRSLWAGSNRDADSGLHSRFVDALRKLGIQTVDLQAAMEKGGAPLKYHFEVDAHWNDNGHALAAEEIAAFLRASPLK